MSGSSPTAKMFAVLQVFAERGSARLTDIAVELNVPKTTLHHITTQLEELGYLQREPGGRQLTIAPRLAKLSSDILGTAMRYAPRHAIIERLAASLGESCSLGIRVGHEVVYLDDMTGPSPLAFNFQTGRRTPLYCTSTGKLFLSRMTEAELDRYLESEPLVEHTPRTITDPNRLREALSEITESNFAYSDDEFVLGVVGAAVPVLDRDGRMLAGLAVSIPGVRMSFSDLPKLKPALAFAADELVRTFD
jgi:IclR family acetate operon transcriptional repressor